MNKDIQIYYTSYYYLKTQFKIKSTLITLYNFKGYQINFYNKTP